MDGEAPRPHLEVEQNKTESANFFYKGPEHKYVRILQSLSQRLNSAEDVQAALENW